MIKSRDPQRRLLLKELGFSEDPFTRSADPRFLYLSAQHGEVLDRIQDVIEDHRGLAVVEGGFGVGKSTIARRLESIYRTDPEGYRVVFVHTASYKSEYEALLDVCFALGVERRKGMTMQWRELENFLVEQKSAARNVVIILDDAQSMVPDALSFVHHVYNFDISQKLAQVILFGQPEIQRVFLERPEVQSRVDSWFRLNPLSLEDTLELIRFRCAVAGRRESMLTQGAFLEVWNATHGTPRDVVSLCSKVIAEMGLQGKPVADESVVAAALEEYRTSGLQPPLPADGARQEKLF